MPARTSNQLAAARRVRFLAATFRNILLVVLLIFIFAVVQTIILWAVCNTGMQTAKTLEHQGLPALKELASLQENLAIYRLDSYQYLFAQQEEKAGKAQAAEAIAGQMGAELKNIQTLLPAGQGRQLATDLETAVNDLDAQFQKVRKLVDADFPAAMKSMDQDIPPRAARVDAAANALKEFGYQFSGAQASATFASFGSMKTIAVIFGIANCFMAFCAFMFVLLAARRSRAQLAETLARLDERTHELQQTNVTLQRQQTELLESRRFLRSALDALTSHIAILDEHGTIIEVNAAWNHFARENDFMGGDCGVGANYLKVCDEVFGKFSEEAAAVAVGIRAIMSRQRDEFHLEYPCHSPAKKRWFIVRATRFGGDGSVRVVVAHENITERKQAEEALRESRERFRFLHDLSEATRPLAAPSEIMAVMARMLGEHLLASRCAYANVDSDGEHFTILHDYTDGCASTVGKYQLSLFGARAVAMLHGGQALIIRNVDAELLPDDGADTLNAIGIKAIISCPLVKAGALHAIMAVHQTTPRDWQPGEIAIVQEVVERCWATIERKRAEEELRESQQRLALATESAHVGIWDWDVVANKTVWDTQMYQLYGIREQDFSGAYDAWQKGLHPEDRERSEAEITAALESRKDFDTEFRVVWPSGEVRHIEAHGLVLRAGDGSPTRMIGVNWDITERKRLENQLVQSQKMETVGKLAGGIAHEFNSILTAIIGQSELLLEDLPAGSPLAENATAITKAANRAAVLTRQLLAYGRKQFLQPENLDLNRVIANMETTFRHLLGGDVDVQIVSAQGPQMVKADGGQIEQVIMNLIINAREAMPNGGKLTLETASVAFDEEGVGAYPELKPGDYVMLAITDTGKGMTAEVKARAFEPFFTTKGVGEGTGLGLSTCYGIVKQSGGHISVYSEPGRGTTFKIYLPQVATVPPVPAPLPVSPHLPRGTETILLVEDDSALREMASTLLRRLGYTILAAANGIEALSLKQQRDTGHVDLLFTDVVMPHMSGKELADRVRALYPHTKILFTSAYTENAIVHQGVLDKGVALLQKPFTPSALARKVREILDQPNS